MADNARNYGFRWRRSRAGVPMPKPWKMKVASGYSATANPGSVTIDLAPGDPVKMVNDGTVALAAAGESVLGVVLGIYPYWDSVVKGFNFATALPSGTSYTAADRASYVAVVPVQGQVFAICCDDAVSATTQAAYEAFVHENADHVFQPSASTKRANPLLDVSTHASSAAQWRIVAVSTVVNQNKDFTGNYVELEVMASEVQDSPFVVAGA